MAQLNDLLVMGQSTLLGPVKASEAIYAHSNLGVLCADKNGTSYYGIYLPTGSDTDWLRVTQSGIIPYSENATSGSGSVGTSTWPFASMYAINFYGTFNGNATGLLNCDNTSTAIQVGYSNSGLIHSEISCFAAYNSGGTSIKNIDINNAKEALGFGERGDTTRPIYIDEDLNFQTCSLYAGGTKITLNGTGKGATAASFYAPTGAGTAGQVLKSKGSGAPEWGTDNNTTYIFTSGTNNKFTVTPSVGNAYDVTVTPYIENNITGTGTSGCLAKFNGTNSITSGPALGTSTTTYLCNNGNWTTPIEVGVYTTSTNSMFPLLFGKSGVTVGTTNSSTGYNNSESDPKYKDVVACNLYILANPSTGTLQAKQFNATSDRRCKTNVLDFTPAHSILDLPIYKFDFIYGAKNQIGCMAQDLQKICPEIVDQDESGYLSIQESKIVYLLIDEIKKLKDEINELKGGK